MKNSIRIIAVGFLCLLLCGCGKREEYNYELAMRHKENGSYEKAIEELQAAVKANSRFGKAHNQLGILYGKVGLYEKAAGHCSKAVKIDPSFASAYYNLGVLYQTHLNLPAKALVAYNRYLDLNPAGQRSEVVRRIVAALEKNPEVRSALAESPSAQMELARKHAEAEEYDRAAEIYTKIISREPRRAAGARVELARLYEFTLGKPDKALKQYQAYLDSNINASDAAEVMAAVGRLRQEVAIAPTPREVSRDTLRKAQELLEKGDIPQVMDILEKSRRQSPENEDIHDLLAEAYAAAGDLKGAEKEYEWLKSRQADFAYDKELAGIYSSLGNAGLKENEYSKAEERFRKAIELAPERGELRWGLAQSFAGQGKFQRAVEEASTVRSGLSGKVSDEQMAGLYLNYARHLSAGKQYKSALEAFTRAKSLRPNLDLSTDMAGIFEGRARLAVENGRPASAEREYLKALQLDPGRTGLHTELAGIYERMGQYDKALRELEIISGQGKNGATAYREMARIHETYRADGAKALVYYRKYLEAVPEARDKAKVKEKLKEAAREKEKIVEYEQAVRRKPSNATTHYNLAVLLQRQGKLRGAVKEYHKALAIEPESVQAHFNLAYSYDRLKMYDEAIQEYRKAIRYKPDYIKAYNNLAAVYKAKGWYGKAISAFKKALAIDSQYAQAHLGLAAIYADELKDKRKAKYHYQQYLQLQPEGTYAPQVRTWLRGMG